MQVLNPEELKKEYSFLFEDSEVGEDIYFCNCGTVTTIKKNNESTIVSNTDTNTLAARQETIREVLVSKPEERVAYLYPDKDHDDDFESLFKSIKMSENEQGVVCDGCKKNFSVIEHVQKLIPNNYFFISGYNMALDNNNLFLYYAKARPIIKKEQKEYVVNIEQDVKYIRYDNTTKKTWFKDFDADEREFDLDGIIKAVNSMFDEEIKNIHNLYYVQVYIGQLSKYVMDVQNTNVVEELIKESQNKFNYIGLNPIKKTVSIFLAIIKYSNLSTIALTKGCKFLYDIMVECDIPNSNYLLEHNLTSPIPIFNFLVKNYINKINEEVNEDNKHVHEFIFKSSQLIKMDIDEKDKKQEVKSFDVVEMDEEKEMKIVYKDNKNYKTKVSKNTNANKFEVLELSQDATASKFIFKIIRNFSDYKHLLKYFKFYNKHQIINLLQKYDINLLTKVVDMIYFRDAVDISEFERILMIIKDFSKQETLRYKPTMNIDGCIIDYSYVEKFDFTYYDDSVMMMEVLGFDPRRHFNKIKAYNDLMEYHDNLVKYFNVVSDKEKNAKFKDFVNRFRFLENREDYDGPIELRLIETPAMLITEGIQMKHSASSYSKKVITESYLIGQIFDKSTDLPDGELDRFTIGFTFDSVNGLEFHQVKGFANKSGSDRFKKLLMEYLTAKDISYRPIKDLKLQNHE